MSFRLDFDTRMKILPHLLEIRFCSRSVMLGKQIITFVLQFCNRGATLNKNTTFIGPRTFVGMPLYTHQGHICRGFILWRGGLDETGDSIEDMSDFFLRRIFFRRFFTHAKFWSFRGLCHLD